MKRYPIKIPNLVTYLLPKRRWHFSRKDKVVYLTFDDGPIPEVTPWVLETLAHFDAKASFFVIGDNVQEHPEILREVITQGHSVGNHTQEHLKGTLCSLDAYLNQITRCESAIKEALQKEQVTSRLFRPPYGKIKSSQAKVLLGKQYKLIMWDVLSADFDPEVSPQQCLDNVLKHTKPGSIVVFHDSLKAQEKLRFTLPKVLDHFSELGYAFKCIP